MSSLREHWRAHRRAVRRVRRRHEVDRAVQRVLVDSPALREELLELVGRE